MIYLYYFLIIAELFYKSEIKLQDFIFFITKQCIFIYFKNYYYIINYFFIFNNKIYHF